MSRLYVELVNMRYDDNGKQTGPFTYRKWVALQKDLETALRECGTDATFKGTSFETGIGPDSDKWNPCPETVAFLVEPVGSTKDLYRLQERVRALGGIMRVGTLNES